MFDMTDVYNQTAALLVLAAALGVLAVSLKQPVLIAFIAAGILAGPSGFGWIQNPEQVHLLAELGLALLLFLVGLKLDVHVIRTMGPVALAVGLGQVAFTAAGGYLLAMVLGLSIVPALYIAVALTFSSTIIIVKLLSDQNESETLHGRIALGILIVQDMLVVAVIIGLSAFAVVGKQDIGLLILQMVAKGAALMAAIGIFSILVLPRLLDRLARSPELLLLFAITWAAALACVTNELGFSKEVGAFLAGIAIASTQYREILAAKLVSVRDFLLLFFFIDLGTRLNLGQLGAQVWTSIILSAFVLIGNPLIVLAIMGFMGYRRRTGFLAGMTVAQISEFSLILGAMGVKLGHINSEAMGIITLVGLITIGLSTYMIIYSHELYRIFGPYLKIFERSNTYREQQPGGAVSNEAGADVILFGCGRYGTSIADNLRLQGRQVLGVDFDPQAVRVWREKGRDAWFGDADDAEFLALLPTSRAKWVISSVGERNINLNLLKSLQSSGYRGSAALTARVSTDVELLQDAGADLVFYPFVDAAAEAVDMICLAEEKERRKRMDKQIDGLSSHYIVCGYGRMGQQIVSDLQNHGLPYVVVESNPEQLPGLITGDILYVEGKATDDETLIRAGVRRAKSLIAVNKAVMALVSDANTLSKAAVDGELAVRAD
ncbi:MAG: cation:proton antiporter, partial [Armatimonadota bacterium]